MSALPKKRPEAAAVEVCGDVRAFAPDQSFGKEFRQARACDPIAFGRDFPDRWCAYVRAHFRSPLEVAYTFGVTEKAAEKWWHGIGGPHGAKVALAYARDPEGAIAYLSPVGAS